MEKEKYLIESQWQDARQSLSLYKSVTQRCETEWEEILRLEKKVNRTDDEEQDLNVNKHAFTLSSN